jgi:hypothetical protein
LKQDREFQRIEFADFQLGNRKETAMGNRKSSKAVQQVLGRTDRGAIERWLTGNRQALAPMLELIENAQVSIDELMHEAACGLIEQLLVLSAQEN